MTLIRGTVVFLDMIKSIISKPLRELHQHEKKRPALHWSYPELVLGLMDAAVDVKDLDFPKAGLRRLSGDFQDFWSVSVNDTYHHFMFRFEKGAITDLDAPLESNARRIPTGNILVTSPMKTPPHPGQLLKLLYLDPLELSPIVTAQRLGVLRKTITQLLKGYHSVTPDLALRLAAAFHTTPQLWLNLQHHYNLRQVEKMELRFKL